MKILFVNPVGQIGGAERVLLDCLASIRDAEPGHELHVLLMDDGPLADEARKLSASVTVLGVPESVGSLGDSALASTGGALARAAALFRALLASPAMWRYVRGVRRVVKQISPDVIHSNGLKAHLVLGLARVRFPVIWHIHDFVGARPMIATLLRRVSRGVQPVAISNAVADDIRNWLPAIPPRVVMNGIDVDRFSPGEGDGEKLDELAGISPAPAGTLRVGMIVTYARWKGQDVFLRAIGKKVRETPGLAARFYIVGGPIYTTRGSQFSREEILSLIEEMNLEKHVALIPFQSDTVSIYRALDIVVHASTMPGPFGLTIAEAMSCGRPVIVSSAGGASELFQDGVDALGIALGDADAMAAAIGQLLEDPALRSRLAQSARDTAKARFNRNSMGPGLLRIYRTSASA